MDDTLIVDYEKLESDTVAGLNHEFEQLVGPSIQDMEKLISSYNKQLQDVAEYFANKDTTMSQKIGY